MIYITFFVFLVGIISIFSHRFSITLTSIVLLASGFLQLPYNADSLTFNVQDIGILLYLILFLFAIVNKRVNFNTPLSTSVFGFYALLIVIGLIGMLGETTAGDTIRYLRHWVFLSIIWIAPMFTKDDIDTLIKYIVNIVVVMSIVLIINMIYPLPILEDFNVAYLASDGVMKSRGVKPPVYSIIVVLILYSNYLGISAKDKIIKLCIVLFSIIISLKMTYPVAIALSLLMFLIYSKGLEFKQLFKYAFIMIVAMVVIFTTVPIFKERLIMTVSQVGDLGGDKVTGNFSYRILHFLERLDYVVSDEASALTGIGYVSEGNFKKTPFLLGQPNQYGAKAQIDTGDIAWSILILRLGVLGCIGFITFYLNIFYKLYLERSNSTIFSVYAAYMIVCLLFLSFGNTIITYSEFYIIPLLLITMSKPDFLGVKK